MIKLAKNKKTIRDKLEFKMSRKDKRALQEIAHKISELRQIESVTQQELAKRMGTSQSVISRIESGKQNLSIDYIQKIAAALGRKISLSFISKEKG